jgi:hypothetical protein
MGENGNMWVNNQIFSVLIFNDGCFDVICKTRWP